MIVVVVVGGGGGWLLVVGVCSRSCRCIGLNFYRFLMNMIVGGVYLLPALEPPQRWFIRSTCQIQLVVVLHAFSTYNFVSCQGKASFQDTNPV